MDKPIPEAVVTDALIADLLPAALIFAENEEHLDHARQRAKTILLETLTAAQQQGQADAERRFFAQDFYEEAREGKKPWPGSQPMQQGGGEVVAWIEPVAGTIRKYTPEQYESNKDMLHKHGWRPLVYGDTAPPSAPVGVEGGAWTDADMQKPWGAEAASLRHLADDPALNTDQAAMLRHCAKRIESTAGIQLRALADMLDPAKQAGVLRDAADALPEVAQQPAAVDEVKIDMALAERVMDALGRFTSDEGWSAADMMTADAFGAAIDQARGIVPEAGQEVGK